jgi:hypothetical protein
VPVSLDEPGLVELPLAVGSLELELVYRGRTLARVQALVPESQWDWEALTERVVGEAGPAAKESFDAEPPEARPVSAVMG